MGLGEIGYIKTAKLETESGATIIIDQGGVVTILTNGSSYCWSSPLCALQAIDAEGSIFRKTGVSTGLIGVIARIVAMWRPDMMEFTRESIFYRTFGATFN